MTALSADYDGIVDAAQGSNNDDEHDPEGATIAFEREQLAALVYQARHHLGEIEAAEARISAGTYDACTICGGPIGFERLEARPTARTCIVCAGS
jgi:RNA polymerase-binding transcription factor DksA